MKTYCVKCRKDTENINPRVSKTTVLYAIVKNQEAKGLLSNLGIRTPLSKVPVLGDILF